MSKLIIEKFREFFSTDCKQFRFKRATVALRQYIQFDTLTSILPKQCTVNLCAADLNKACDKVKQYALFIKFMNRNIAVSFMELLQNCFSTVKFNPTFSLC